MAMPTHVDGSHAPRAAFSDVPVDVVHQMLRVVGFADVIGALTESERVGWDYGTFQDAVRGLARHGIGVGLARLLRDEMPAHPERLAAAAVAAIEQSPIPDVEWAPIASILRDQLPALVGASASSVARYQSGERPTPDPVAGRLHVIAQIVAELSGSYNDFGIRRWFERPRQPLDGKAPAEILTGDWDPDQEDVVRVRTLARSLLGAAVA